MQPDRCKHFTGVQHKVCKVGIRYADVTIDHEPVEIPAGRLSDRTTTACRSMPCIDLFNAGGATCPKRELPTAEEIAAHKAAIDRRMDCLRRGISHCCEAPIDESRVIRSGRHKGHGTRYCGKCGRVLFIV